MKITLRKLANGGLYLSGPDDTLPEGFMRRYKGVAPWAKDSIISRDGSTKLYDLNAHSIVYFASNWWSGVSTSLYRAAAAVITGLSGDDLSFAIMAPVAGISDYLFLAGGDTLYKIDSSGDEYYWGIEAPAASPTVAVGAAGGLTGAYAYRITYLNSTTGHRSNSNSPLSAGLLCHCDGADEATTFTDSSNYAHTITPYNNTNTEQSDPKFGTAAAEFDGSNDYMVVADHPSLNPDPSTGVFTFDCWVHFDSIGAGPETHTIVIKGTGSQNFRIEYYKSPAASAIYAICTQGGGAGFSLSYSVTPSTGSTDWYHVALTRTESEARLFWDGTSVDNTSSTGPISIPGQLRFGADLNPLNFLNGKLDEIRFISGVAAFSALGFTVPSAAYASVAAAASPSSEQVDITNIPESSDPQVDTVEIWRTVADGTLFFKLTEISNGTSSYTDNIADAALSTIQLPTDNHVPYSFFDDCFGPWNASIFWITRSEEGERGRLYYSAIGRAEAMQGFIEVTSDSDGLQKILSFGGNLFVISQSRVFQIYGANPYFSREVAGVPGTNKPKTVVVTPFGVIWEAHDGVRLFTGGSTAQRIAYDKVAPIFRGRTIEGISSFSGDVATFARGEYIISDGTTTLALDIELGRWRNIGIGVDALFYSPEVDIIAATYSNDIIDLENEGDVQDVATDIPVDILTPTITFDPPSALEMIRIDANANGETLTLYREFNDTAASSAGTLTTTAGRRWTEFDFNARLIERLAVQISGSVGASIEILGIEITHWPLILILTFNDSTIQIPGRLAGNRQAIIFEPFSDQEFSLQSVYLIRRLFYDINSNSNELTLTLRVIVESGTESNISIGTIDNATRTVDEINIERKGRFSKLTIAGDFTDNIAIRRLELDCVNQRREG